MSQFFDYELRRSPKAGGVLLTCWAQSHPVLAVASAGGRIEFFNEEGEESESRPIDRNAEPTALAWHHRGQLIAAGWDDGVVTLRRLDGDSRDSPSVHRVAVRFVQWNAQGNRFVTGDDEGVIGVWRAENRGHLSPISQYRKRDAPMTHCVFVSPSPADYARDTHGYASPEFLCGGQSGLIVAANDHKQCVDVHDVAAPIDAMVFFAERRRVIILTRSLRMVQLDVAENALADGVTQTMKVKVSVAGEPDLRQVTWASPGLLATASPGEKVIRFWDLAGDENYVLGLSSAGPAVHKTDRVSTVSFNPRKRVLAAGTRQGKVLLWRLKNQRGGGTGEAKGESSAHQSSASNWEPLPPLPIGNDTEAEPDAGRSVTSLQWGPGQNLMTVALAGARGDGQEVHVMNETVLHHAHKADVAAMQLSASTFAIEEFASGNHSSHARHINAGIRIKGLVFDGEHVVVWNGAQVEVYEKFHREGDAPKETFKCNAKQMVVRGDSIFRATTDKGVEVSNLSGHVKSQISFTEEEGAPELLHINGKFMAVATSKGLIKVYDIGRREPTQLSGDGRFEEADTGKCIGIIRTIRVNADGTRVSILSDVELSGVSSSIKMTQPDTRLHVYSTDTGRVISHEFGEGRVPVAHSWDADEPKLLACETLRSTDEDDTRRSSVQGAEFGSSAGSATGEEQRRRRSEREVTMLFATPYEIMLQHSFELEQKMDAFLGLHVPRLYFISKIDNVGRGSPGRRGRGRGRDDDSLLQTKVLRDFVGMTNVDEKTRKALLDFSFNITRGNMDEAHKAVKQIKSTHVWQNMAHMCVKTKRLDVAEVCLGNMGHARGARAVREAKKEPELEARVAMVAIHLGLLDDAAKLYRECGRYDLLNKLYQAAGRWDRALAVADEHDRIHLKTTHYLYATHLESMGDTSGAIRHFERSDTHRVEVPRLLYESNYIDDLEEYVQARDDKALFKWWAQYCESNRDLARASRFYERAGDNLSLTRVACFRQDWEGAKAIVRDTNCKASAYHLARQFEAHDQIQQAITYFSRAETYSHAIRLAKEHDLDTDLMSFAIQANKSSMLDTARYFEQKGDNDKAVQLYQKGGNTAKALELCFHAQLFDMLRSIADDLSDETSPQTLARCADFFIDNGQFEKACHLYVKGKRFDEALDLCVSHKVKLTEDMAEAMTLPKSTDAEESARRQGLLDKIARVCKKQGSYQLACKKFTQAGDKLKAMKCLLKSGDTEKIIFFTKTCRNRNIYVLAANYLQNLDWHNDTDVMKAIVQFYTKAKAFEQLSGFYDACAQVEMDEYRDYEKAVSALQEAVKYMTKGGKDEQVESLQRRIELIEKFAQARRVAKGDPDEMVKLCTELLERPDLDSAIRVGDCLAMLIEHHAGRNEMERAHGYLERMRARQIALDPYVDQKTVSAIYSAVGVGKEEEKDAVGVRGLDDGDDSMSEDIEEEEEDDLDESFNNSFK